MDWLAGSRLHLVDAVVTRALSYIPIFALGFSEAAMIAYAVVVTIQATFIHANVSWELKPLRWLLVTPRFHHWHHSDEQEALDKNFAVHIPIWDWLFRTYYMPANRWPESYGLIEKSDVPNGFLQQVFSPLVTSGRQSDPENIKTASQDS